MVQKDDGDGKEKMTVCSSCGEGAVSSGARGWVADDDEFPESGSVIPA